MKNSKHEARNSKQYQNSKIGSLKHLNLGTSNLFRISKFGFRISSLLAFLFVFTVVGVATAQEIQRTYTLINPSISHTLAAGEKAEGTTKIINQANTPLTFKVGVQDYIVSDTKGTPQILPPNTLNNKYSGASWIAVTPSYFTLEPGASQVVNYYIQTPPDAKPGGHYAAIVYEPVTDATPNQTGGTVNTQIGALFYITIKGPVKESASVVKFFTGLLQEYGPIKILTQVKNMSDLHIMPKGKITVTGIFFNESQNLEERNIFPEVSRDYENTFGSRFMIGPYKASLAASYGINDNLPLVASLTFWVFPWKLALIILLVIVAVVLGVTYYRRREEAKHKGADKPTEEPETGTEK